MPEGVTPPGHRHFALGVVGEGKTMLIATERLTLREFVADDWPTVLAYQSDPR
jgi:hypothetical protein